MHNFLQRITNKSSNGLEDNFKMLPDFPLEPDREEEMRFKHEDIAKKITETFKNAKPPFTVGLYGKWGTGKTTIAKFIQNEMKQAGYQCLYFDSWKYEQDSLRRQFLIELDSAIFGNRLGYANELNQSLTKPEKIVSGKELFKKIASSLPVIFIVVMTGIMLLAFVASVSTDWWIFSNRLLFQALFETSLLGMFSAFILKSFDIVYGTIQEHRTDSAEGFESHFNNAFNEKELDGKTLFVVIDNIDRIEDSRKAANVLSDIKTFLSQDHNTSQKVLFLIPCDDEALRDHLKETHGNSSDVEEFLRKFFNLTVKIPKFIDIDFYEYIRALLKETQVEEFKNDSDLEGVITEALRSNPREVKQFINSLIPLVLLARERNLQVVLDNVAFLAKLQIIRQKFPILYEILEERALREQITLKSAQLTTSYKEKLKEHFGVSKDGLNVMIEQFDTFNENTPVDDNENIDIFLSFRQLPEEKEIPEWRSFVIAAESKDIDKATEIVKSIKKNGKTQKFEDFLKSRVKKLRSGIQLSAFVSTAIKSLSKNSIPLKNFLVQAARYFPYRDNGLQEGYKEFSPTLVFKFWYPEINRAYQLKIVNEFTGLLGLGDDKGTNLDRKYALELLQVIAANPDIFEPKKEAIQQHIEKYLFITPYIMQFSNTEEARGLFISEEASAKCIESLNSESREKTDFDDAQELEEILDLWHKLPLNRRAKEVAFKKYKEIAQMLESSGSEEERATLLENLYIFTRQHKEFIDSEEFQSSISAEISEISEILARAFGQVYEQQYSNIINIINLYYNFSNNEKRGLLQNKIIDFIRKSTDSTLMAVEKQVLRDWTQSFPQIIAERGATTPNLILENELYGLLDINHIQTLIVKMVDNGVSPQQILQRINYETENNSAVIKSFIQNIHKFDTNGVRELVNAMKKLGIERDGDLLENLKNALKQYKNDNPSSEQEILKIARQTGRRKLFNYAQEQDIENN